MTKDTEQQIVESGEHYYLKVVPPKVRDELRRRHSDGKRRYHTWEHVRQMFRRLELVDEMIECLPGVILATVSHDSILDPRRKDNEIRSAALMRKLFKGSDLYWIERADTLILATQDHRLPSGWQPESDAGYFLDMDLGILGAEEYEYDTYAEQVEREYAHLAPGKYAAGRTAFLRSMLAREQLFYTQWGRDSYDAKARINMQRELEGYL